MKMMNIPQNWCQTMENLYLDWDVFTNFFVLILNIYKVCKFFFFFFWFQPFYIPNKIYLYTYAKWKFYILEYLQD